MAAERDGMRPPPDYPAILARKLAALFPDAATRARVERILADYPETTDRQAAGHVARVRLAALKLAGDDLAALERTIAGARVDFRDVVAWAENPRRMNIGPLDDPARNRELVRADAREYTAWLGA